MHVRVDLLMYNLPYVDKGRQTPANSTFKESRYFQLLALPLLLKEPLIPFEVRKNSLISIDYGSLRENLQLLDNALLRMNIRRERLKQFITQTLLSLTHSC